MLVDTCLKPEGCALFSCPMRPTSLDPVDIMLPNFCLQADMYQVKPQFVLAVLTHTKGVHVAEQCHCLLSNLQVVADLPIGICSTCVMAWSSSLL